MAQSYTWNTSNPADRFNGPVTWTDRSNDYQLNQLYLYAEKTTDTKGCGWDFGWRADIMSGTDYRFNTAAGLETRTQFQSPKISTAALLRHRVHPVLWRSRHQRLEDQGWSLVCPGRLRSRADNRQLLPQPALYLPIRRTVHHDRRHRHDSKSMKTCRIGGGIQHGWDNFDNSNPNWSWVGAYTEKFSDGASLAFANTAGQRTQPELLNNGSTSFRYLQTNVYSRPLKQINENLTYVAQSDFGTRTTPCSTATTPGGTA